MNGADLLEDGVPHGTTAGYEAGCRSLGGCPGKDGPWAQTCMTAKSRSRMEFAYGKAVGKDRELEFLQEEAAARTETPAPSPRVTRARRSQQKEHGVPADDAPKVQEQPPEPEVEEARPHGKRVLDDALRTITEAAELQRALAVITERALRTARIEINHMRREAAAPENQQEK